MKCKQIHHPNSYISRNSAAGYYSTFRALLKIAYKMKILREDLNDFLEKIEWKEVKKEYLTLDEVKQLTATFIKKVFAHALRDIEVSTFERKMSHTECECRIKLDVEIG